MNEPSDRSRGVATILAVVTGLFGGHRFYAGKVGSAFGMLFTGGGLGLWWLYDCILVASGEFRDIDDRRIVNWEGGDAARRRLQTEETNHHLLEAMEDMRSDMSELQERVDFMERMVAEVRQRPAIRPPSGDR